eukprot:364434-Chlamydomonas_euryale.AAC.2
MAPTVHCVVSRCRRALHACLEGHARKRAENLLHLLLAIEACAGTPQRVQCACMGARHTEQAHAERARTPTHPPKATHSHTQSANTQSAHIQARVHACVCGRSGTRAYSHAHMLTCVHVRVQVQVREQVRAHMRVRAGVGGVTVRLGPPVVAASTAPATAPPSPRHALLLSATSCSAQQKQSRAATQRHRRSTVAARACVAQSRGAIVWNLSATQRGRLPPVGSTCAPSTTKPALLMAPMHAHLHVHAGIGTRHAHLYARAETSTRHAHLWMHMQA